MSIRENISEIFNEQYRRIEFRSYTVKEFQIKMRDGISLLAQAAFPDGEYKSLPIILQRTPYGPKSLRFFYELSQYGYICISQNCRGCFGSQGEWCPAKNERNDGIDTLNWIISQSWCDGNIGMTGSSYLSMNQWIIADILPKEVKTLYLEVYNPYRYIQLYSNGMFKLEAYTGWTIFNSGVTIKTDDTYYEKGLKISPPINMDKVLFGQELPWYRSWITHSNPSDKLWHSDEWGILEEMPPKVKVPVFMQDGWYDSHLKGMLKSYDNLTDDIKKQSILMVSPLNHIGGISSDIAFPNPYGVMGKRFIRSKLMWFDFHLKGMPLCRELKQGTVNYYILGRNKWKTFKDRQIPTKECILYLNLGNQLLSQYPTDRNEKIEYTYNPRNPVQTCGSDVVMVDYMYIKNKPSIQGMRLLKNSDDRQDVISFYTEPLKQDTEIAGSVTIKIFVKSSVKDTAFTAKLSEVYEDGSTYHIREEITTLCYKDGDDSQRYKYTPGNIIEITIRLWEIMIMIKKGNRLRLDISSSSFPAFHIHPNTETLWSEECNPISANQTIYAGKDYPSRIILPVIK